MSWHDTSGVAPDAAASRLDREWRASVDALVAEADAAFDARRLARQRAAVARRVAQRAGLRRPRAGAPVPPEPSCAPPPRIPGAVGSRRPPSTTGLVAGTVAGRFLPLAGS